MQLVLELSSIRDENEDLHHTNKNLTLTIEDLKIEMKELISTKDKEMSFNDDQYFDPIVEDDLPKLRSQRKPNNPYSLASSNQKSQGNLLGPQN